MALKTPLYELHLASNAKMVDFHGWLMPLHYGSQLEEHHAVRQDVGVFDVSHMVIVDILGAGGRQFLRKLLTNDVDKLSHSGSALYSCMCNAYGGIMDDLIVYQRAPDNYRLVLNAANRGPDMHWIRYQSEGFSVGLQERKELGMLAIQGPKAFAKLMSLLAPAQADAISTLQSFESVDVDSWFFARTGYTGEDGMELILPVSELSSLWSLLLKKGVKPCGLGARDTLRLEAGFLLHGQDMTESTTPLESGLAWTVQWEPRERNFIGMEALLSQQERGIERKLMGLILEDKGVMRTGQRVLVSSGEEGIITSGSYSPTLEKSIALARLPISVGEKVMVDLRGKQVPAKVTKPRFVKNGRPVI